MGGMAFSVEGGVFSFIFFEKPVGALPYKENKVKSYNVVNS